MNIEWGLYATFYERIYHLQRKQYLKYLSLVIIEGIQKYNEQQMLNAFKGFLRNYIGLSNRRIEKNCKPYVDIRSVRTDIPWHVAETIEFIKEGIDGIIYVMPFTCETGNVYNALIKKIREDHNNFPCLVLPYEGLEVTNTQTRLEGFVYQVKEYTKIKQQNNIKL